MRDWLLEWSIVKHSGRSLSVEGLSSGVGRGGGGGTGGVGARLACPGVKTPLSLLDKKNSHKYSYLYLYFPYITSCKTEIVNVDKISFKV